MYQRLRIIAVALLAALLPAVSLAQLSCDEPPAPFDNEALLANWQQVWNLTDVCKSAEGVFYEIMSGGVGRDGIPPIDNPQFDDLATADLWLQPSSPVIALEIDGIARAYPLAILTRHEIANDIIGDTPVARGPFARSATAPSSSTGASATTPCASASAACCATAT